MQGLTTQEILKIIITNLLLKNKFCFSIKKRREHFKQKANLELLTAHAQFLAHALITKRNQTDRKYPALAPS